jgi:predicted enzyme related to lactoylglutathione lyase
MLKNAMVITMLPVVDMERARKFYGETLGQLVTSGSSGPLNPGALYEAGGETKIHLFQRASTKARHTVVSFLVSDIEDSVNKLKARGIVLEVYDTSQLKTVIPGGIPG